MKIIYAHTGTLSAAEKLAAPDELISVGIRRVKIDDKEIKMVEAEPFEKLVRFMYLTLGYYGTEYNYDQSNWNRSPITGDIADGILVDKGEQAREAIKLIEELGFSKEEILNWKGPR